MVAIEGRLLYEGVVNGRVEGDIYKGLGFTIEAWEYSSDPKDPTAEIYLENNTNDSYVFVYTNDPEVLRRMAEALTICAEEMEKCKSGS